MSLHLEALVLLLETIGTGRGSRHRAVRLAETRERDAEQGGADHGEREEWPPDDVDAGPSVEDLFGEDETRVTEAGEGEAHGSTARAVTTKGRRAPAQSVRADWPLPGIA